MKNKGNVSPMVLVSFAVVLILGVVIFAGIDTGVGTAGLTGAALAARNNVSLNTYGAFQITSVGPYVMGAVIILGIVGLMMSRR